MGYRVLQTRNQLFGHYLHQTVYCKTDILALQRSVK